MFGRIALVISAAIYCFPRRADETRLYPRPSITFLHPFYLFPDFFRNSIVSCSMKLRLLFQHGSSHFWSIWSKITLLIFSHTVCNHQFREKIKDLILFLFKDTLTYILLYIIYYINLWYTNGILLHFFSICSLIHSISTSKKLSRSPISQWPTVFGTFEYWRLNRLL